MGSLKSTIIGACAVALVLVTIGLCFIIPAQSFVSRCQQVQGTVNGKSIHYANPRHDSCRVHYTYTVNGVREETEKDVTPSMYDSVKAGSPITVFYLPSDPANSTVDPAQDRSFGIQFIRIGIVAGVVIIALGLLRQRAAQHSV